MSATVQFNLGSNHNTSDESSDSRPVRPIKHLKGHLKRSFSLVPERLDTKPKNNVCNEQLLAGCEIVLEVCAVILVIILFPFSLIFSLKVIAQYQRAVVFRLGKLINRGPLGPGLIFILPCLDTMKRIDLRTLTFDVPTQEVLTRDSVTVAVDAVVYYRIFDPVMSVVNVEDANRSTRLLAQTTLRNVLGTVDLYSVLTDREDIAASMQETLDVATDAWGMKVERVEVKDVRLPMQLQRAMAAEAEATREARAKVIAAEGEQKSSKALRLAAEELYKCPISLQLRYLQTLNSISAEKNSTIIFPLPIDILTHFQDTTTMHQPPSPMSCPPFSKVHNPPSVRVQMAQKSAHPPNSRRGFPTSHFSTSPSSSTISGCHDYNSSDCTV